MQTISELKANAREQLKGRWGSALGILFLYCVMIFAIAIVSILLGTFIPLIGNVITILIGQPLALGVIIFSLKFKRGEEYSVETLFAGFKQFLPAVLLYLWNFLWICLWTLLLIIPGIIKSFSYSMCYYILADNPEVGVRNALTLSKQLMSGYKWKYFVLQLSFIGWSILACLSLGIGYLWLAPYMQISMANFYDGVKEAGANKGIFIDSL